MRTRVCRTCHQPFATAESLRVHKTFTGCRTPDSMRAAGWVETRTGWQHAMRNTEYARRKR